MKYDILRLDGRFTYRDLFAYCIKFSNRMSNDRGPLDFNTTLKWFTETYGWSAEIRQYDNMLKWVNTSHLLNRNMGPVSTALLDAPDHCNPNWSWTNGYQDLRIYVKSDSELNFFQLKYPCEQRSLPR